jgi:hypothetical protein
MPLHLGVDMYPTPIGTVNLLKIASVKTMRLMNP